MVRSRIVSRSLGRRELHQQLEEEAVELGFGQRVGAFHFERVLRGQHEERRGQAVRFAGDGDRVLLHRFEQGGLGLGRGAVDFVGQQDVGEDRAALKLEHFPAVGRLNHDVRADEVGRHQVGRELDAAKIQMQCVGQRADDQRLAEAGNAFEQHVPAGEQRDQHVVENLDLADDDLGDLGSESLKILTEVSQLRPQFIGDRHRDVFPCG